MSEFSDYTAEMTNLNIAYDGGHLEEGKVPLRLIEPLTGVNRAPFASWKFWYNGKQYGQWVILRTPWEIENARRIALWHAQEHLKAVSNNLLVQEPDRLKMWMWDGVDDEHRSI